MPIECKRSDGNDARSEKAVTPLKKAPVSEIDHLAEIGSNETIKMSVSQAVASEEKRVDFRRGHRRGLGCYGLHSRSQRKESLGLITGVRREATFDGRSFIRQVTGTLYGRIFEKLKGQKTRSRRRVRFSRQIGDTSARKLVLLLNGVAKVTSVSNLTTGRSEAMARTQDRDEIGRRFQIKATFQIRTTFYIQPIRILGTLAEWGGASSPNDGLPSSSSWWARGMKYDRVRGGDQLDLISALLRSIRILHDLAILRMDADGEDSRRDDILKDSFGRGMNNLSEASPPSAANYKLPADRTEMERLAVQHRMWTLLVGGPYPPTLKTIVDKALSGPHPTILDAGCGSANWCIEMAELYPNTHVIGADLARNADSDKFPTDLALGLPACRDPVGYDLIHSRSFHSHASFQLKDPLAFMYAVVAALKPGGLFIVGDLAEGVFSRDKVQLRPRFPADGEENTDGSWTRGWQKTWLDRIIGEILTVDAFLKRGPFSIIFSRNYLCPAGWDGDGLDRGAELGEIMLKNLQQFNRASMPALLTDGKFSREELELWIHAMEDEFKNEKLYLNWHLAVGLKSAVIYHSWFVLRYLRGSFSLSRPMKPNPKVLLIYLSDEDKSVNLQTFCKTGLSTIDIFSNDSGSFARRDILGT
ncbi:hypothetical protein C8R45DRAFT_924398 [Mycena sanguinolenta]|nr:hypothetical protein C8R45DRAFT_924398 [Mycena sanguinolenta]